MSGEKEYTKLEKRLDGLEQKVQEAMALAKSKISVDEAEAKKALDNVTAYSESARTTSEEIKKIFDQIAPIIKDYDTNKTLFEASIKNASEVNTKYTELTEIMTSIASEQAKIQSIQTEVNSALTNAQNSENQIKTIENDSTTSLAKIKDMLSKSTELKTEISNLYDKVFGYDTDNGQHEEGLKEELDKTYETLNENMAKLSSAFNQLKTEKTEELNLVISEATKKHTAIIDEIKSHLPNGVAAGLAGAFHEKKETETKVMADAYKKFNTLVISMVVVALLPFAVYVYWLHTGKPIDDIIKTIPNMTLAVLPLYAPLIWLGIHLNKKINLSKKLIEEYAYKEAISKTVTGVSEQIKTLNDENVSQEIYTKLLHLIISTNADNPGRFITEYDKCDNPFIEMISNPKKFEKLLEKPDTLAWLSFLNSQKEMRDKKTSEPETKEV